MYIGVSDMKLVCFLVENTEWIFSGIGVAILGVLLKMGRRNKLKSIHTLSEIKYRRDEKDITISKQRTVTVDNDDE